MKILIKIIIAMFMLSTMFFSCAQPQKNVTTNNAVVSTEAWNRSLFSGESKLNLNYRNNNETFLNKLLKNRNHRWRLIEIINDAKISLENNNLCSNDKLVFSKK
jgi:hypothetical protein